MSKFKVDDKVVRINFDSGDTVIGGVYTIRKCQSTEIYLEEGSLNTCYSAVNFELYEEEKTVPKFKKGDKLLRIKAASIGTYFGLNIGDTIFVSEYWPMSDTVALEGHGTLRFNAEYFELIEDTSKHHKHHDLIIAWAKGAVIQYWNGPVGLYVDVATPGWDIASKYRIKPEPEKTPEQIEKDAIVEDMQKLQERLDKLDVK